jgi:hypothetical protein
LIPRLITVTPDFISPTKLKVRVPANVAVAGTGFVAVVGSDTIPFKSTSELVVSYALAEDQFPAPIPIAGYDRFYLTNLPNCAKGIKRFVIDKPNIKAAFGGTDIRFDSVKALIDTAIFVWKTKLNQLYPDLNLDWSSVIDTASLGSDGTPAALGTCLFKTGSLPPKSFADMLPKYNFSLIQGSNTGKAYYASMLITLNTLKISDFSLLPRKRSLQNQKADLYEIILHEIAHALGLKHIVTSSFDLMYPVASVGVDSTKRKNLTSGSIQTIPAVQQQINESKSIKWVTTSVTGNPITVPVYPFGGKIQSNPIKIAPTITSSNAYLILDGQTKSFSVIDSITNTILQNVTYKWQFLKKSDNTWVGCGATATTRSLFVNNSFQTAVLSVKNNCSRTTIFQDTVPIRCEINDGCNSKIVMAKIIMPFVQKSLSNKDICKPKDFANYFLPSGGIFTCTGCPVGALTGSILDPTNIGTVTVTYTTPLGCSASIQVTKVNCRACTGFSILNANNICIYNNQNTNDVVSYSIAGMIIGCPPLGSIFKAEMIPFVGGSWATPTIIGQTTNDLIDIPITIAGTQASGTYLVRVAVYNSAGIFQESSINTKTIQIGRATNNFLGYTCLLNSNTGGSGGSGGTGRLAPPRFTPEEIALYPNPTTDRFTLQVPEYEAATEVLITDIQGRIIDKRSLYSSINEIETNELPNGIYFVRIAQGERSTVLKLVIVK